MKYEMVYFDLDNTILDFNKSERFALIKTMEYVKIPYREEYTEIYREINKKWWKLFSEKNYPKEVIVVERFREFFETIGKTLKDYAQVAEYYIDQLSETAFFVEGAENFLEKLIKNKQRMAVITNGVEKVQKKRSKIARLDRFFEFVLTSEKAGKPKPAPEIFYCAAKLSGVPLNKSVYIGDNPETDLVGAQNAGVDFILFDPDKEYDHKVKKFSNFEELIAFLV
ncbi:YjjG family noncanonical pyrimidine nucleotidase [Thermosipho ferrireducens]|uniref:YjjG family noncanonical pyrimidine nucleotidase n=1 Tax=Thermosipho ferrireducens TaxID=2571116 RepID=A0ABX7S7J6_9BACT|nr:YjjG family noncanonical pyrimidine nucleotidase [Thermosipho ferrireducens]QTA38561.1 YjjG family noncanonical pyrimidine nucleotidase [Thermosipho ferrireducens]